MTKAEQTLRIDREGCLICRIGFMVVSPFKHQTTASLK